MDELTGPSKKKTKSEKQVAPQDRATLTATIATKLDDWLKQIDEKHAGLINVSKSDLVNYFLEKQPEVLNRDQLEKIKAAFFDEVRFAQWALKQIKESKQKGESLSLKDIVASSRLVDAEAPKRTKPPKSIESTEGSALINDHQVEKLNGDKPAKP